MFMVLLQVVTDPLIFFSFFFLFIKLMFLLHEGPANVLEKVILKNIFKTAFLHKIKHE